MGINFGRAARPASTLGQHPTVHHLLRAQMRLLAVIVATLAVVHLLAGCGGGDPDEPLADQPAPGLNCATRPEVCK